MSHPTDPSFTTAVHGTTAGPIVQAAGELDLDAAPILDTALHRALAADPSADRLVIDLAGVTFCDSSGLGALLRARIATEQAGLTLHLARPAHAVAKVLELTGAYRVFPVDRDGPALPYPHAV
ncbi:STAS domain-containing protein [Kitasatospora sp. NBC_00240]|uniref:STAS domain-containing protein n=1 Tax=Kitasatospora sp. NBC_00240 TaxID=2903567 RepID=UPI00225587D6|nr:STAS domain-containing protein [Kitasatospora sp. NBC_00240]MCX5215916.1 STAS domain-containing protein [Kitasatospora sp. NBC_00240]